MGMTSLSIVLTVFVLQLHHVAPRQERVPLWLRKLMIHYAARALCMKSHLYNYYACNSDEEKNDVCLLQTIDYGHTVCNNTSYDKQKKARKSAKDGISGHLKIIVSKQGPEEEHQNIVNEWKLVALIVDRFLFVVFLVVSILSSFGILVFKPLTKPAITDVI